MSFQYAQYGEGFSLQYPEPPALRFDELVQLRGEFIKIIQQTRTDTSPYGQPIISETSYTEKVFIENNPREQYIKAGYIKQGQIIFYLRKWAPISEDGYVIEYRDNRYHIAGLNETQAYIEIKAERMTQ